MIDQQGLFRGDQVGVREYFEGDTPRYDVLLYNRQLIATLYDKSWANALAEVVEGFVPRGASLETALRFVNEGMLSLSGARFMLAGILRRAAERRLALSLEVLDDREREAHRRVAEALRTQAELMDGGR